MAKRRSTWNKKFVELRYADGYRQGRLGAYKPWLQIQDVPSK